MAPRDLTRKNGGRLTHEPAEGDGVRAFIVSSRDGELKGAMAHKSKVDMVVENAAVKAGDTIDFIVDIGDVLNQRRVSLGAENQRRIRELECYF